jgi:tRNA-splicing ligase RtcB
MGVMRKHFPQVVEVDYIACHHNYVSKENHYDEDVLVTRKGAIYAGKGTYGIIPGSMGTKSYIVRGLGNTQSFCSASHGAGRRLSRGAAKREFSEADLLAQTEGVECRKDLGILDEIPGAYKDIDAVMENQKDLVEIVATLKQVLCVKG